MPLSPSDLDDLQRTAYEPPRVAAGACTAAAPHLRSLLRIRGIGRFDKVSPAAAVERFRLLSEDLIAGLYNDRTHLAFILRGVPGTISVEIGTWLTQGSKTQLEQSMRVLESALASLYPSIDSVDASADISQALRAGLALGVPTAKPPDLADGALPIDRLIRAMRGQNWTAMVLAQPVEETVTRDLRRQVINDMRAAQTDVRTAGVPSPLADHFNALLEAQMLALTQAQGVGAWRTAVYLLADDESYSSLAGVW